MNKGRVIVAVLALFAFAAAGLLSSSPPAGAQDEIPPVTAEYFLKIEGIPGESLDEFHTGEIEIDSFAWGAALPEGLSLPGAAAVRPESQDFQFMARQSLASPGLVRAVATGAHYPEALFTVRSVSGDRFEYFKVKLEDVVVTSYNITGTGERPVDTFSLGFGKITYEYTRLKADGTAGETITVTWDLKSNTVTRP